MLARPVVLAAVVGLLSGSSPRLNAIDVEGQLQPGTREVTGRITTAVRTPLGNVPVTSQVRATYRCDGSFSGSLTYGSVIRMLARIRGAALVNVMEGHFETAERWNCHAGHDRFTGSFTLADSVLTGHLAYQGETVPVAGFTWTRADRQFHTRLSVPQPGSGYTIHVTLAER
jgi:hypothetical protein